MKCFVSGALFSESIHARSHVQGQGCREMPCSCRLLFEGVEILLLYSCMGCGAVRSEYAPCKCRDGRFRTVHPEGVHGKARWLREVRAEVTS